jgi:hypothetical protein
VHLYQGTSEQFIADAVQARLANQLAERFFQEFRYKPSWIGRRRSSGRLTTTSTSGSSDRSASSTT